MRSVSTRELVLMGASGALYAIVGYITWNWIPLEFYGVRFWPQVVIPGTFAALFGGLVGGIGAAIGIFISDVLIHGNAFLSLLVGVPANFLGFYIVGRISKGGRSLKRLLLGCTLGLVVGSLIIGFGLVSWSQYFPLPFEENVTPLRIMAALSITGFTFISEIPFLYFLVPPIVKAVKRTLEAGETP